MEKDVIISLTENDMKEFLDENPEVNESAGSSHDMLAEFIRYSMTLTQMRMKFMNEKFPHMESILEALWDVVDDLETRGFRRTVEHFRLSENTLHVPIESMLEEDGNEELLDEDDTPIVRGFVIPVKNYHDDKEYYAIGAMVYVMDEEGHMTNDEAKIVPVLVLTEEKSFVYHNRLMTILMEDVQDEKPATLTSTFVKISSIGQNNLSRFKGVDKTFAKCVRKAMETIEKEQGRKALPTINIVPSDISEGAYYLMEITSMEKILRNGVIQARKNNKNKPKKGQYALTEESLKNCLEKYNCFDEENWAEKIMDESIPL